MLSRAAEYLGERQCVASISLGATSTLCLTAACVEGFLHPSDKHNRDISLAPVIFDVPHLCGTPELFLSCHFCIQYLDRGSGFADKDRKRDVEYVGVWQDFLKK